MDAPGLDIMELIALHGAGLGVRWRAVIDQVIANAPKWQRDRERARLMAMAAALFGPDLGPLPARLHARMRRLQGCEYPAVIDLGAEEGIAFALLMLGGGRSVSRSTLSRALGANPRAFAQRAERQAEHGDSDARGDAATG